jgi:pimeloyl-ACP methyl ester carboxylesterase
VLRSRIENLKETLAQQNAFFFEPRGVSISCDAAPRSDATTRHCILLHGWNSPADYMSSIKGALQNLPQAACWNFWSIDYPTHRRSFREGAREVARALAAQPHDFSGCVFVGFSMGGLVARQMVADGFGCRALVSICSPHEGLARWVPTHSPGTWSLSRSSVALRALNRNPIDRAHRDRYHLFAVTYRDRFGYHDDDTIVTARSALGARLGVVAERRKIHLEYGQSVGRKLRAARTRAA